jgi:hypothetical protein
MPRKSVYFPDEQWPRIERAAELEDRSVSKWIQRATTQALDAMPCEVCGAGRNGRCDPPDSYVGGCPHGCSPER